MTKNLVWSSKLPILPQIRRNPQMNVIYLVSISVHHWRNLILWPVTLHSIVSMPLYLMGRWVCWVGPHFLHNNQCTARRISNQCTPLRISNQCTPLRFSNQCTPLRISSQCTRLNSINYCTPSLKHDHSIRNSRLRCSLRYKIHLVQQRNSKLFLPKVLTGKVHRQAMHMYQVHKAMSQIFSLIRLTNSCLHVSHLLQWPGHSLTPEPKE